MSDPYTSLAARSRTARSGKMILMLGLFLMALTVAVHASFAGEDSRYTDHGDQTITDSKTGLMWMKQDSYLHTGHWLNWFEASKYIEQLNEEGFAGYHDWRVPGIEDLKTLYDPGKTNSSQVGREMVIHMDPIFAKEGSGSLWAAESNGNYNAFGLVFNTGDSFNSSKRSRSRKAVRAMRGPL